MSGRRSEPSGNLLLIAATTILILTAQRYFQPGPRPKSAPAPQTSPAVARPGDFTPELSRRARGVEVWAALRSLGRAGIAEVIERNCAQARRFAQGLSAAGFEVLNEVVLNQVLVSFGDAEKTTRTIQAIQDEGTCWCGITVWQGRTAMRISVSSWATTDADVELSLGAIVKAARG